MGSRLVESLNRLESKVRTINLLWTGGWDSTYRLLELSIVKRASIQPFYVFDSNRRSSPMELQTQDEIRGALQKMNPEASTLILPTKVIVIEDIAPDASITSMFDQMKGRSYIGYQYDYLARMAKSQNLNDLELSVHKDDLLFKHLDGNVEPVGDVWRLSSSADASLWPLRYFSFPLLKMTKKLMEEKATIAGFAELLELTWFCHFPVNSLPCGGCNPCRFTIEEGLGRRVPWQRRLRHAVLRPLKAARNSLSASRVPGSVS
jgi:hypothetical protein